MMASRANPLSARTIIRTFLPKRRRMTGTIFCSASTVPSLASCLQSPKQKCRLDGSSIYLSVQRKAGHLSGWVKDEKGNPIPGATIHLAGLSKVTDSSGHFEFAIFGDQMQGELDLEALAPGYVPVNFNDVPPDANPLTIQLKRKR